VNFFKMIFFLKKGLTKKEMTLIPRSFDLVGDILIFSELTEKSRKKRKQIGEEMIRRHKNVKVVCEKVKEYSGTFRTPTLKILAGEKRKETMYIEHGCRFKLNVEKAYFSPRLSTERKRIYQQVNKGESVLVMFSGVAPYVVVIAKNTAAKEVYGIEINPSAHKYAKENIKLNKLDVGAEKGKNGKVKLYLGDVRNVLPKINKKFDRIIMPLPKTAEEFLDVALKKIKKKGIVHFYDFQEKKDIPKVPKRIVVDGSKKAKKKIKILKMVKCGQYGPRKFRICVDFRIL